jgi:uncharacterized protein (TIGR03083 family)
VSEPLPFDRCLQVIERAGSALGRQAAAAGLQAPVPTCPTWSIADLVAHQGMVHRWADAQLRLDPTPVPSETDVLRTVPAGQLGRWFTDGLHRLLATLQAADPDVPAMVFLRDAPRPRHFWARRQAHETTIHSVDALAGALGRLPSADEAAIDADVAVDGIDELLTGFYPRGRSNLASGGPLTVAVVPTDADRAWTMRVADGRLTTERRLADAGSTLTGTAAELYLGLWNRGEQISESGQPGVLERWREVQRVRWS